MRILVLTERFYPEDFLINDLCSELKKEGVEIEVLTQVPSYPKDAIYEGYRNRLFQTTNEYLGIPIHRVRTVLGYNRKLRSKVINYISFAFWTSLWALFNGWKYQRIFTYQTGPLSMASAGIIFSFIWRKKCMIWTQDIWPDTVYHYGIKKTFFTDLFLKIVVKGIYSAYNNIAVSCPGFVQLLRPYTKKKIYYIPQWATNGSQKTSKKEVKDKKIFTFAGNIGSVQNIDLLVEAFECLPKSVDAELRIIGDGIYYKKIKSMLEKSNNKNIVLVGKRPKDEMPKWFYESDVLIISLKPQFNLTIPAKFQAYLAAGRAIFGAISGDVAMMIDRYSLGYTADPSSRESITNTFIRFCNGSSAQFDLWQKNALYLSTTMFDRTKILLSIKDLLHII